MREALTLLLRPQERAGVRLRPAGVATPNFLNNPARFAVAEHEVASSASRRRSRCSTPPAGRRGADGIREKDGKRLKLRVPDLDQLACARRCRPSSSRPAQKAGIEVELKAVTASVFFSSDVGNPDTYGKFWRRHPDVHRRPWPRPTPSATCDRFVVVPRSAQQGEQVARPQPQPLAQRRVRQAVPRGRSRARPGQARGAASSR